MSAIILLLPERSPEISDDDHAKELAAAVKAIACFDAPAPREASADRHKWDQLLKLAREIDPTLPADLSEYELRITLNRELQSIELVRL